LNQNDSWETEAEAKLSLEVKLVSSGKPEVVEWTFSVFLGNLFEGSEVGVSFSGI